SPSWTTGRPWPPTGHAGRTGERHGLQGSDAHPPRILTMIMSVPPRFRWRRSVTSRPRRVPLFQRAGGAMAESPQTRFVRSGDIDLAYQVFGAGEDMVAIPGLPSHLEMAWELPEYAAFLDRLASYRRVIMFDKRGTGMSGPVPGVPVLEQQVDDIIAVM